MARSSALLSPISMAAAILACRSIANVSGAVTRGVFVRALPERAFEAFVRVSEVLSWLADGAVIGARAGGNWALGWYADPDSDAGYSSMGQIETFEPGRTLAVSNLVFSSPEGLSFGPMRLVITFEAVEEGTDVTVDAGRARGRARVGVVPRPAGARLGADARGPQGLARGREEAPGALRAGIRPGAPGD